MSSQPVQVVDRGGHIGSADEQELAQTDSAHVSIMLDDGRRLRVTRDRMTLQEDGSYRFAGAFEEASEAEEVRIPLAREEVHVSKRQRETGRVRIHKHVVEHTEEVDEPLLHEEVEVQRVPVDRVLEEPAETRQEGDVLIIPVMEERLVLTKQWVLKEELHVRRRQQTRHARQEVTLRRQEVEVERTDLPESPEEQEET